MVPAPPSGLCLVGLFEYVNAVSMHRDTRRKPVLLQSFFERPSGGLAGIASHARVLRQLNDCLKRCLPPPLCAHATVAQIIGDVVIVHVDSPAWHARMRFLAPDVLAALKGSSGHQTLRRMEVKVSVRFGEKPLASPRRARLSRASADCLRSTAESVADPALKSALLRLARR